MWLLTSWFEDGEKCGWSKSEKAWTEIHKADTFTDEEKDNMPAMPGEWENIDICSKQY